MTSACGPPTRWVCPSPISVSLALTSTQPTRGLGAQSLPADAASWMARAIQASFGKGLLEVVLDKQFRKRQRRYFQHSSLDFVPVTLRVPTDVNTNEPQASFAILVPATGAIVKVNAA